MATYVLKRLVIFGTFALLALAVTFFTASRSLANTEIAPNNLEEQFQEFKDNWQIFTVWFVSPVNGDSSWDIPKSFEDNGEIIARRILTQVGTDHFCVQQINQGYTENYCVPFSNVAYIDFLPGDIEQGH